MSIHSSTNNEIPEAASAVPPGKPENPESVRCMLEILCLWVQMRERCDPGAASDGYNNSGWRYTKSSLSASRAPLRVACMRLVCAMHAFSLRHACVFLYGSPAHLSASDLSSTSSEYSIFFFSFSLMSICLVLGCMLSTYPLRVRTVFSFFFFAPFYFPCSCLYAIVGASL